MYYRHYALFASLAVSIYVFVIWPLSGSAAPTVPRFSHIFIIVLENKEFASVIGNPDASYFNQLAQTYGLATQSYGQRHPSLPNYLALTSGSTQGITSDCTTCFVDALNIVDQLEAADHSWKAYMESMPQACFIGDSTADSYWQKHNPFIYYDDIRTDPTRCNKIVPFTDFATDLQSQELADYVWITPNMCNSQHDCSIKIGDSWLQQHIPAILASPAWQQNGLLLITYDEGSSDAGCCTGAVGGQIPTLVISPLGKPAYQSAIPYDHYSLLRTVEESWGLPLLANAVSPSSPSFSDFFTEPQLGPTLTVMPSATRQPTTAATPSTTARPTSTPVDGIQQFPQIRFPVVKK